MSSASASPARTLRVLPSRERVAEVLRERVRAQGIALALGLIDLRSFEDRLIRAAGLEPVATTQARLLVTAVAPEAASGTTLAELASQPGFAESFLELWDTLRRAGIDLAGFERLARRLSGQADSSSGRRFGALARIAAAYEGRLRARGVVDGVGARVALPRAIASLGARRLASLLDGAEVIEVERSAELPVIRARMWEALARAGLDVRVEIPVLPATLAGPHEDAIDDALAPELVASLELMRRNLVEEAPSVDLLPQPLIAASPGGGGEGEGDEGRGGGGELAAAGLIPFVSPRRARALAGPRLRAKLELVDAEDERAALRGVCAAIREALQAGVAPHRITVAVPRLGLVRHRVLAALDAAELPREEIRGQPVMQAAPLRLAFALIDAAERELPREALATVLESAYVARWGASALLFALREAGSRDDRGIGHVGRLRAHAAKLARPREAPPRQGTRSPEREPAPEPDFDPSYEPPELFEDLFEGFDDTLAFGEGYAPRDPALDFFDGFDEHEQAPPASPRAGDGGQDRGPEPRRRKTEAERRLERSEQMLELAARWEPVLDKLRLRREATLREHLDAVFAALRALGIARRCLALPALGEGARERRLERDAVSALARDRAALEALEIAGYGLDEAAAAVGLASEPVSLTDFRAHLEATLAGVRERPAGVRGAGIALRDFSDLARSPSEQVFVLDVVEGRLPGPGRALPFLDDDDRQALDRAAGRPVLGAPTAADAGNFALACAGIRERLTLVAHRQDQDGREVMRSRWFVALARALGDEQVRPLRAGVIPSFAQASTRGQLLTRMSTLTRTEAPSFAQAGPLAGEELAALEPALRWAQARADDLPRASLDLDDDGRGAALRRLDFDDRGARPEAPGLVWRGSATSLEDYAACPFRFFAKRVLRIRPPISTRDDLDAAEQGSVRHLVLAEVMQALRAEGLTPLEGGDRAHHESRVAHEVCEAVLDRWQRHERTGPLPLWTLHRDLIARDLARVLEGERRVTIEAWEPGEFEVGFGVEAEDDSGVIEGVPLQIPDRAGGRRFELVGRVDRIDYRGDGREQEGLIIDYKSGRVGDRLRYDELARTQLQLPLYAAWLQTRRPELSDADAAYVSLRDGERSQVGLLDLILSSVELDGLLALDPGERRELRARAASELRPSEAPEGGEAQEAKPVGAPAEAVGALDLPATGQRNLADNVWALLGGMARGRFDVRPHDPGRACRYCAFGPVCRVERGDEIDD